MSLKKKRNEPLDITVSNYRWLMTERPSVCWDLEIRCGHKSINPSVFFFRHWSGPIKLSGTEWRRIHVRPNITKSLGRGTLMQEKDWFQTNLFPILACSVLWLPSLLALIACLCTSSLHHENIYVFEGLMQWFSTFSLHGIYQVHGWLLDGLSHWVRKRRQMRPNRNEISILYRPLWLREKGLSHSKIWCSWPWRSHLIGLKQQWLKDTST